MKADIKKLSIVGGLAIVVIAAIIFFGQFKSFNANNQPITQSLNTANLASTITASGNVEAQNQATLTFLTSGRISYVGVKEGDLAQKEEVLASLDTTIIAHNETAAEAEYRSARSALNKILDDIHLFQYGNGGFANVGTANETQTQKTQRQQAEETVNVAYDNLQSARKQLELSSIIAPFDGKILTIANISEGSNVSPTSGSSITITGGGKLKFVADVLQQDIDNVHIGQTVTIKLDNKKDLKLNGTVEKIAGGKTTLPDGRNVFKVDIQSISLQTQTQAGQTGSIEISIDHQAGTVVVPSWTVLANKYIWVISDGQAVLKEVKVGQTIDGKTSIISGLSGKDRLILDPQLIARNKYKLL